MAQQPKPTSVTFIKPWNRYTKGDRAGFDADRAKSLVERKIAVFTKDAPKQAATPSDAGTPTDTAEGAGPNATNGQNPDGQDVKSAEQGGKTSTQKTTK
ncbi:hypothetical protein R5R73_04905 [Salinicola sp. LHM]|uniref:hypothetical protein n=1 Tax=Salinicola sp. LHM TaxID=3065298 RepID=UPI002ACE1CB2|nr:hypothetical protein [Salinicola sp. LHM]WQH34029.1 hypothetical protein R5R73_04905 [Salinicola sp. LHM]